MLQLLLPRQRAALQHVVPLGRLRVQCQQHIHPVGNQVALAPPLVCLRAGRGAMQAGQQGMGVGVKGGGEMCTRVEDEAGRSVEVGRAKQGPCVLPSYLPPGCTAHLNDGSHHVLPGHQRAQQLPVCCLQERDQQARGQQEWHAQSSCLLLISVLGMCGTAPASSCCRYAVAVVPTSWRSGCLS